MSAARLQFDPDMALSEFMQRWPETVAVFERYDMLCVGCLVGPFHTISDACLEHEVEEAEFLQALAQAISLARAPH
jgi:hybrid cluster-associated redox disulfide protein